MGVDYTAITVIGVTLPKVEDIPNLTYKKTVRKKAFKHSYKDDGTHEFDPKTGAKLFLDEKEEITVKNPDLASFIYYDGDLFCDDAEEGQKLIEAPKGMGFATGSGEEIIALGFVIKTEPYGSDYVFAKVPDIEKTKSTLKSLLEPHGLWKEKDFGIHVILCAG
jgi:hypothetical protein